MRAVVAVFSVLILCFGLVTAAEQQPPPLASIEGTVTRAGTGQPIAGATMTLLLVLPPVPPSNLDSGVGVILDRWGGGTPLVPVIWSAPANAPSGNEPFVSSIPSQTTDGKGAFVFRNLQPGSYQLAAAADGYVRRELGGKNALGRANSPTALAPGQTLNGIRFNLTPTGAISGRVHDFAGMPLAGVPVSLYRRTYNPTGELNPTITANVRTNDRGEYRIFWVAPGRYFLAAGGKPSGPSYRSNELQENFSTVVYSNGTDPETGATLEIKPGAELGGMDMRLSTPRFYRIRGRLVDAQTAQPPAGADVTARARLPNGQLSLENGYYDAATGSFEIVDVVPGVYNLASIVNPRGVFGATGPGPSASAFASVRVTDAHVEDVTLSLTPAQSVAGRLETDGSLPAGARFQVRLQSVVPGGGGVTAVVTNPDGSFILDGGGFRNGPGEYRVTAQNLPSGWYMASAKLGELDVMNAPARFPSAETLTIRIRSKAGQIEGIVRNASRQALSAQQVVLASVRREPAALLQTAMADASGRFRFSNVPAGEYRLFSWEESESGTWFDPEFMKEWEAKGVPVSVTESSTQTIELIALPSGGLQ